MSLLFAEIWNKRAPCAILPSGVIPSNKARNPVGRVQTSLHQLFIIVVLRFAFCVLRFAVAMNEVPF